MIEFACSSCGRNMRVKDEYSGKKAKCPTCGQPIEIPRVGAGLSAAGSEIIKFRCEHCNQKIGLPARYAGKRVRCAKCQGAISVPQAAERSAQASAEKIQLSCDHCGKAYAVPAKYAGKRVKCKQCGEAVTVPDGKAELPAEPSDVFAVAAGGMGESDTWAGDLLAMEASAPEAEDVLTVKPLEPDAAASESNTFDDVVALRGGAADRAVRTGKGGFGGIGGVPVAIVASFCGALLGALIWLVIAAATGYQIGYVAWGVGALAGVGMSVFTDRQSVALGVLAAFFGLCGILMGKVFVAKWVVLPMLQKGIAQFELADENIAEMVDDPDTMFSIACLELVESGEIDEEVAWDTIDARMVEDVPAEMLEKTEAAAQKAAELSDRWSSRPEKIAAVRAHAGKLRSKMASFIAETSAGLIIAFVATFSFMDLLWFLMALGSAYTIGSGRNN